jgi:hypothetical protein
MLAEFAYIVEVCPQISTQPFPAGYFFVLILCPPYLALNERSRTLPAGYFKKSLINPPDFVQNKHFQPFPAGYM